MLIRMKTIYHSRQHMTIDDLRCRATKCSVTSLFARETFGITQIFDDSNPRAGFLLFFGGELRGRIALTASQPTRRTNGRSLKRLSGRGFVAKSLNPQAF